MKLVCKYGKLYYSLLKINIKIMLAYRADFFIGILSTLVVQVSGIVFIWAAFSNVNDINGWSFYQVTYMYGLFTICKGLNHIFFDNLWIIGREFIRKGTFDTFIIRPANILFQVIASKIQPDGIGEFLIGIFIFVKSFHELQLNFDKTKYGFLVLSIIIGTLIIAIINLIFSISSFWILSSNNVMWVTYSMSDFALYPINVYNKAIQIIISFIIPYAFVSYFPSTYMLNVNQSQFSTKSVVVLMVLTIIARYLWKTGLRKYEGTGN